VSPRPGGETDKLGNKYELAWAIRHALYCILDDRRALTAEDIDPEVGQGSEFSYETGLATEAHQLKRQNGNSNSWTVKALADLKIFGAAAKHVAAGRRYHFVSLVPCRPLQELSERARKSADLTAFTGSWLTGELTAVFDQLTAAEVLGSPQAAWETLRGMWFSVQDEYDIVRMNSMLAECHLDGATGHLISLAIGDILLDNLGKRMTRTELLALLAEQGIKPLARGSHQTAHEQVLAITNSWRQSIQRELLQPPIERAEASQLVEALDLNRIGLIAGTAGGGKSSVLEQTLASLESTGAEVLALRLDRLDPFASTAELGRQLGIETSPAVALALAADDRDAYLVIDQLDAVSLASGRMPESFDVVMDLIGEALSVAGMRVVLACRQFDIDNDHRIRALASRSEIIKIEVGLLAAEDVDAAVTGMGLDPTKLSPSQRALLQTPLHLVLLQTIASQGDALAFKSKGSLFEAFWERKRQAARTRRQNVRFNDVVSRLANAASDRQVLSVPIEILDDDDLIEDANVLVSEHVLARDGDRIAFFHETFFDYAFARQWVSRAESLVDFLLRDEQELFRRAQVRQILQHLYEREHDRFRAEAEAVLTAPDIRFHIKETVLAVVANFPAPTSDDAAVMVRVAATHPRFEERLWQQLRRPQWFARFHEDGQIATWLDGPDEDMRLHALNTMVSAVKEHPMPIATLLGDRKEVPEYLDWLRWVTRFADIQQNRELFDLVLEAVRQGAYDATEHELWLTTHGLAKHEPLWAIELLQARLIDHVDALSLNDEGKAAVLGMREYGAAELVKGAASAKPLEFVQTIVPYLRQVMAATAYEPRDDDPIRDHHFSARSEVDDLDDRELDDALLAASVRSLETLAQADPEAIRSLLEELAADPYDGSQFLLYRALAAGGEYFADWSASLLLEGGRRLDCGYISDSGWVARELVRAIAPYVSDEIHRQLEDLFRDLRNEYETRPRSGRAAFMFLSALDEPRLTSEGQRRLGEYRRKFEEEAPAGPHGITGGFIGSPIAPQAAQKMTDDQWLGAMAKHDSDKTNWSSFTGGARELSNVLKDQVAADPARFANLALRLTHEFNPAYTDALLMGFGDAEVRQGVAPLIFDAVRNIASLGQTDNDRWIGMALRKYYREVPLDLVELVRDRALHAPDPTDSSPVIIRDGSDGQSAADMRMNGMNTARGSLAEALGDLLVTDSDGQRTALVVPYLDTMASDPVLSVRSCVAHTLAASLRHARPAVLTAFEVLIDADDRLLAAGFVQQLMLYIGNVSPEVIDPVIQRMLTSEDAEAREAGGVMAAFAALEWSRPELMEQALTGDVHIRKGIAEVCAVRVDRTSNADLAATSLIRLMNDDEDEVRRAAAAVAPHLREHPLQPFAGLLRALIDSPSYDHATPQLLLTLQYAPDKVDELVLRAAHRFIDVFGKDAADIRTGASGDAHYISELVVRGLAQSRDRADRAALLDVLDLLLELGVYGINDAIAKSERF
jgi:hypothetical protein